MSRRGKRLPARRLLAWLVALALVLSFAACTNQATPTEAPSPVAATPATTSGTPGSRRKHRRRSCPGCRNARDAGGCCRHSRVRRPRTAGTPAGTATAAPTPTPTATLTELQARLTLAKAYLDGKDYDSAATLYGADRAGHAGQRRGAAGAEHRPGRQGGHPRDADGAHPHRGAPHARRRLCRGLRWPPQPGPGCSMPSHSWSQRCCSLRCSTFSAPSSAGC